MSIFEYDEELHMRLEREDAMEEGIQQGEVLLLISQIKKKWEKNLSPEKIADALEEELIRVQEILAVIGAHPDFTAAELYGLYMDRKED